MSKLKLEISWLTHLNIKVLFLATGIITCNSNVAEGQIIPDRTLPNNSQVTTNNSTIKIDGGTVRGTNLFHSFTDFSISSDNLNNGIDTAYFNNANNITNIFSRVTGSSLSHINGLIKNNGNADLFLINPNGVIFGENAVLDLGGSFITTTADSIQFSDGNQFSAVNTQADSLLTVSIPVGLQYGAQPGNITVRGTGNGLIDSDDFVIDRQNRPLGLEVAPDNTLALMGGNVFLEGGNITASSGNVAIASIKSDKPGGMAAQHFVGLSSSAWGWEFDYAEVDSWGEIGLSQSASIDISGSGGEVELRGGSVSLKDGSAISADTWGDGTPGSIEIEANDINISGINADNFNSLLSANVDKNAVGNGSNITLKTDSLSISNRGQIYLGTNGMGNAGDLTIDAAAINIAGDDSGLFSAVAENAAGNGANIYLHANQLVVKAGGQIAVDTRGLGNGGNLNIDAGEVSLTNNSGVFAHAITNVGNGGDIAIATDILSIRDDAEIYAGNFDRTVENAESNLLNTWELSPGSLAYGIIGTGEVGNIEINANSISLNGSGVDPTGISTTTYQQGGGIIKLNAATVSINNAQIAAETRGDSHGGALYLNADNLYLNKGGQIVTSTLAAGNAGKIAIAIGNELIARGDNSGIFSQGNLNSTGNTGKIGITGSLVDFSNGSRIDVSNLGSGEAGTVTANAEQLNLAEDTVISDRDRKDERLGNISVVEFWTKRDRLTDTLELFPTMNKLTQLTVSTCSPQQPKNVAIDKTFNRRSSTQTVASQNLEQIERFKPVISNSPIEARSWVINSAGKIELLANSCI